MAKRRRKLTEDDLEFLPPFLKWVAKHPLLYIKEEDMSVKWRKLEKEYLVEFPCPNQMARHMLTQYRGNPDRLEKLYFRVCSLYAQSQTRKNTEKSKEEDAAIADLEAAKAAALGALQV